MKVFSRIFQLKGLKPKNKGHTNFYECCDLTEKVYLTYNHTHINTESFLRYFLNCYNWIQRLYVKTTTLKKQGSNSKCPFSSLQSSREIINATIWVSYFNMFGNYRQVILPRVGFIMRCLKCGRGKTIKKDWIFPWKIVGNWVSGTFQLLLQWTVLDLHAPIRS